MSGRTVRVPRRLHPPLPGPYALTAAPQAMTVTPAVERFVADLVRALLAGSPAFYELSPEARANIEDNLTKIAAYSAALIQDGFAQSEQLGQAPVLRRQTLVTQPLARAAEESVSGTGEFAPRATDQVGLITGEILDAVDFPSFVADLLYGTFNAIVDASIQQMEAYGELLANVAKTVDQFMVDNITYNQARDYLVQRYPAHFVVDTAGEAPRVRTRPGAEDRPAPDFRRDLGVDQDVQLDDGMAEEVLVPAARRQLAQSRHQLLSTMVLMGINRIVVTSGRVRAKMDFHIDARDYGTAETASQFDYQHEHGGSIGGVGVGIGSWLGGVQAHTRTSLAYVRTAKQVATDEINVDVDLTGELDLRFKSETFPLERFADSGLVGQIQAGTANPAANQPAPPTPAPRE